MLVSAPKSSSFAYTFFPILQDVACPLDACVAIKQKYNHLEMELRGPDDTLLSLLEYGADPKEMEHPGVYFVSPISYCSASLKTAYNSLSNRFDKRLVT